MSPFNQVKGMIVGMRPLVYKKGILKLLDQTKLPQEVVWVECKTYNDVAIAIKDMIVRGALLLVFLPLRDSNRCTGY